MTAGAAASPPSDPFLPPPYRTAAVSTDSDVDRSSRFPITARTENQANTDAI